MRRRHGQELTERARRLGAATSFQLDVRQVEAGEGVAGVEREHLLEGGAGLVVAAQGEEREATAVQERQALRRESETRVPGGEGLVVEAEPLERGRLALPAVHEARVEGERLPDVTHALRVALELEERLCLAGPEAVVRRLADDRLVVELERALRPTLVETDLGLPNRVGKRHGGRALRHDRLGDHDRGGGRLKRGGGRLRVGRGSRHGLRPCTPETGRREHGREDPLQPGLVAARDRGVELLPHLLRKELERVRVPEERAQDLLDAAARRGGVRPLDHRPLGRELDRRHRRRCEPLATPRAGLRLEHGQPRLRVLDLRPHLRRGVSQELGEAACCLFETTELLFDERPVLPRRGVARRELGRAHERVQGLLGALHHPERLAPVAPRGRIQRVGTDRVLEGVNGVVEAAQVAQRDAPLLMELRVFTDLTQASLDAGKRVVEALQLAQRPRLPGPTGRGARRGGEGLVEEGQGLRGPRAQHGLMGRGQEALMTARSGADALALQRGDLLAHLGEGRVRLPGGELGRLEERTQGLALAPEVLQDRGVVAPARQERRRDLEQPLVGANGLVGTTQPEEGVRLVVEARRVLPVDAQRVAGGLERVGETTRPEQLRRAVVPRGHGPLGTRRNWGPGKVWRRARAVRGGRRTGGRCGRSGPGRGWRPLLGRGHDALRGLPPCRIGRKRDGHDRRARPRGGTLGRGRPAHALGRAPAADLGLPARAQLAREELGRTAQRIAGLGETEVLCEAGERVVEAAEVVGGEPPVVPGRRKARSETSRLREARERLLHSVESREGVALVVPVAGLGGREPDRLVEAGEPFLEPAELREQHALRPPCRLVARVEGEGAVVAVEGRGVASRRQHVPLVVPGERIAWVGLDRLVEAAQLLGRPAEPAQDDPLRDPGLRAARVERERAIERGQARLEPTLVHEQQTLVEPGISRVGVESDRLLESGVRLLQPAEAAQGVALVRVDLRLAGGECERAVVADDGLVESPQADQRDPAVRQVGGRVLDRRRGSGSRPVSAR